MPLRLPGPHSTAWVLAETGASAGVSLVTLLLIGRVIGPHEAGIGAVAIAAFLLLDVFGAALFPDALVQRRDLSTRHLRSALTVAVLVGLVAALLLLGAAPLLAVGAGEPALAWLLVALAPLLPVSAFCGAGAGLAMREQRFRLLALRVLVGHALGLAAGLVAAAWGFGAWAMVVNQAVATLVILAVFLVFGRLPLRPLVDRAALGDLWPVALPQIAAVVLMVGKYRIFLLALGLLLAEAALALAHVAFRMLDSALHVVRGAISRIALPRLCALQGDRAALAQCYGEMAELTALVGLPIALGVALVADDLVVALLGAAWAGTAEAARIVALSACLTFLHGDQFSLFVAAGRPRLNTVAAVANLAVPLLALLLFQPETAAGAALAWSVQTLVVTPVFAVPVLSILHRSPWWLLRQAMPGLLASAAMVPAVLVVEWSLAGAPALLRLVAAVVVGGVVFVGAAWLALGRRLPRALASRPSVPASAAGGAGVSGPRRLELAEAQNR